MMGIQNYLRTGAVEVTKCGDKIHYWVSGGVYSVLSYTIKTHGQYSGLRFVSVDILDTYTGFGKVITFEYSADFDDYEIIHRWVFGTDSCDCARGKLLYKKKKHFKCNKNSNRFILRELTIKGGKKDCVLKYRGFV